MKKQRRKFRTTEKRLLSFLLCAAMVIPLGQGMTLQAAEGREKEGLVYLDSGRISQDKLPDGDYVYFGTATAAVEERGEYALRIYREGDIAGEASVDIRAIDMTALYGKDYELAVDGVKTADDAGEETILQKYVGSIDAATSEEGSVKGSEKDSDNRDIGKEEEGAAVDGAVPASLVSTLAKEKEKQTGKKTRELTETDTQEREWMDELTEAFLGDAMDNMEYSASCSVTFEAGEDEKIVRFRVLEDKESEGTEAFCLVLANPKNARLYEVSSASISIQDDEPAGHSEVSFTKSKYKAEDGRAVLSVKRTGAEYSVCDMTVLTCEDTAKAGEDYIEKNETLAFAPYEMEKEIVIDVEGRGSFDVLLTGLTACTEGECTRAEVSIAQGKKKAGTRSAKAGLKTASDEKQAFGISINNKKYTVEYKKGDATGKIMDDSYSPAVEAGIYYFSSDEKHGGIFSYSSQYRYGDKPPSGGVWKSEYIFDEKKTMDKNFGKLEYYSWWKYDTGGAYTRSLQTIPGAYYQYFVNDWRSKSGQGSGQNARLDISWGDPVFGFKESQLVKKEFSKTQDKGAVKNTHNEKASVEVHSFDDNSWGTPKSYLEFYGLCAMYKKFNVSLLPVSELRYRTGTADSFEEETPVQVSVKCGAQVLYQNDARDIYANLDEKQSNLVFSIADTYLNGHTGKFGHITGYNITVDAKEADKKKTVRYPEDFINYLNSKKGRGSKYDSVSFTAEAVESEIKKVNASLDTVPYDAYFLYWIDSVQNAQNLQGDGYGYKGVLKFQPRIGYDDVTVEVLPADGTGTGHFTDLELKKAGKYIFHAGDSLDLEAVADDSDNYHVSGYQYSADGGITFNTITDGSDLFLESGRKYQIRPVISKNDNAIEVQFASSSAASGLEIQGLISQKELEGTEFEGKNILNLNPAERSVEKKARPVPGRDYAVRIAVKEKEKGGMVYRSAVKMKSKNAVYTTQCFYMVAASDTKDNIIVADLSSVKKSEMHEYQVVGNLVSDFAPIRSTGLETKQLPVSGYTVVLGTGSQSKDSVSGEALIETAASTTGDTGAYTLAGISGRDGDIIPMLLSNGTSNGQVVDVKLTDCSRTKDGTGYKVDNGNTELGYPYGTPRVTSIAYKYDKSLNNQNSDLRDNSVHIYDDTLTITAKVDTYGRNIKEAVFTVYRMTGMTEEYHAKETEGNKNTFECVIPKMTENLFNGDRVKVRLVDSEELFSGSGTSDAGGKVYDDEGNEITGQSVSMEYPDVDTGLVFFVENVLVQPQNYELQNTQAVNVPMLGVTTSNAGSGMITFGKSKWSGGKGYTIQVGVDALYSSFTSPTTEQKLANLTNYHNQVKSALNEDSKANAEDVILNQKTGDAGKTKLLTSNLKEEKSAMEDTVDTLKNDPYSKAKQATAGLNKNAKLNIDIALLLAFDFVYDPVAQEYVFCCGSVAIGGTFSFLKTWYTNIEGVPVFLNLTGTLQLSGLQTYNTEAGRNALTAGDFDSYTGNLAERLSAGQGIADLMFSLKLQVGEGICGVLAARGFVTLKLQFELRNDDMSAADRDYKTGAMIAASGGAGFDLLLFSINIEYGNIRAGWGTLETQPTFSFFGGMADVPLTGTKKASAGLLVPDGNRDAVLQTDGSGRQVLLHQYSSGTSDMSGFGKSSGRKKATLKAVSVTPLLDNAAEHARPRIIPLDGDRKMMVFIGSRGGANAMNSMALYYTVYDGSAWSEPQVVADDGTADSTPDIMKKGNKVIIAWADASREFTLADINSTTGKLDPSALSAMNISVAIYDISSGVMGDEITLVDDNYFNLSPQLNVDDTKIYCSYMKRDLANAKDEMDLLDFRKVYSTMAYVAYDFGGEIQDDGDRRSDEKFIEIPHSNIKDPLVTDFTSVTTKVDGDTYLLSAYTIDEDETLATNEDRELYLQVYNVSKDRHYYPVRISDDSVNQGNPKLTDLDGVIYLTWMEDGYMFHMMDVSEFMELLFDTGKPITVTGEDGGDAADIGLDKGKYIDGYMEGGRENRNWYKQGAKDLGIDEAYYEDSPYADIAEGNFHSDSANFRQNEGITTSISNYSLVTDGKDIYIFFTDSGSEEDSTGVELYGVKYQRALRDRDGAMEGSSTEQEGVSPEECWGFGKAVQLTHKNKVIDEVDMYVTEDGRFSFVSNYYSQWIDGNGNMQYGTNQIVEIECEATDSLVLEEDAITLPTRLVGGETDQLSFEVRNNGLLDAKGFDYTVSKVTGGAETVIGQGHSDVVLKSCESVSVSVPWTIPEDVSNTGIKVTVRESGIDNSTPVEMVKAVPYGSSLSFEDTQVLWNGNTPYVETTLINKGNAASKAYSGILSMVDSDSREGKTYNKFSIPALASGESKTFELPFTPEVDDFSALGTIDLKIAARDGEESVEAYYTRLVSSSPVCAPINGGEESIKLAGGKTATLKMKVAPWEGVAGDVRFYSSDEAVAVVDDKGVVTATGQGKATIYAYYANLGVSASIDVSVSGQSEDRPSIIYQPTPTPTSDAEQPTPAPSAGQPTPMPTPDAGRPTPDPEQPEASAATKKITVAKGSAVVAAGTSKKITYVAEIGSPAETAAPVTVSVSGNKKVTARITDSKVKITVDRKAVKGSDATVTLKSRNAAGKDVKAAIMVKVQNKTKKLVTAKKSITVKKGKRTKLVLKVTAQNKKRATTDTVKVSSNLVALTKQSSGKGKITLVLKGKKKGHKKVTFRAGSKKIAVKVRVR